MKQFLKMTWTSYGVIYFIKEDRKRNCLNVNFAFFSLKQGARPFYQWINSFEIESFSISDTFQYSRRCNEQYTPRR